MNANPEATEVEGNLNEDLAWLSPILMDLGVRRMEASLNGGGDSGDLDEVIYLDDAGELHDAEAIETALKAINVSGTNALDRLHDGITQDANNAGNWYDNEGGSVVSAYEVTADGVFTEFVSIAYHEEEYDDEYDDDDYDDDGMEP